MRSNARFILVFATLPLVAWVHCTKQRPATPEGVVEQFVRLSAEAEKAGDQHVLRDLCTGDMRAVLEEMPSEVFRISYLNKSVKLKALNLLSAKTDGERATVEYEVDVENNMGKTPTEEHVRREVELKLNEGRWRIRTIRTVGNDRIAFTHGMVF